MGMLEDAEDLAAHASAESGLDDRPHADPAVMAVCYCKLRLVPHRRRDARLVEDRLYFPRGAPPQERAFLQAHEVFHDLVRDERARAPRLWRISAAEEETVASRGGCALLLPSRAFLRDVRVEGVDLERLGALWTLASPWVLARRVAELRGAFAVRRRRGRGIDTAGAGDPRQLRLALDEAEEHGVAKGPGVCAVRIAPREVVGVLLETG